MMNHTRFLNSSVSYMDKRLLKRVLIDRFCLSYFSHKLNYNFISRIFNFLQLLNLYFALSQKCLSWFVHNCYPLRPWTCFPRYLYKTSTEQKIFFGGTVYFYQTTPKHYFNFYKTWEIVRKLFFYSYVKIFEN